MNAVNLTAHEILVVTPAGEVRLPPSGTEARVSTSARSVTTVRLSGIDVEIVRTLYAPVVEGLPAPREGTLLIVSRLVRNSLDALVGAGPEGGRPDVVCPDTSPDGVLKKGNGIIEGVKRLSY